MHNFGHIAYSAEEIEMHEDSREELRQQEAEMMYDAGYEQWLLDQAEDKKQAGLDYKEFQCETSGYYCNTQKPSNDENAAAGIVIAIVIGTCIVIAMIKSIINKIDEWKINKNHK